jgi:hypothetical protein
MFKRIKKLFSKDNLIFFSFIFLLLIIAVFSINFFSYFNPLNLCYITINGDPINGNKATIFKAIKTIKAEDKEAYHSLCKYVERINEKYCMGADPRGGEQGYIGWHELGCYIKGSEVIYLKPQRENSPAVLKQRVDTINKYTNYSKNFWENL